MISVFISRLVILSLGTLYPAYASYKAVKNKNVKEYVKWMMYWIVFALFTCAETFADLFLSWFPFYYEIKIIFVLWLLSPATKGSSILYRRFVHPHFAKREEEIDGYIAQASEQGYYAVVTLGSKGLSYAANMVVQGQQKIVEHIKTYNDEPAAGSAPRREAGLREQAGLREPAGRQRSRYEYDEDFYDDPTDGHLYVRQPSRDPTGREAVKRSTSASRNRDPAEDEGDILPGNESGTSRHSAAIRSEKSFAPRSVDAASVTACE